MASAKKNAKKGNLVERGEKARDLFYAGVGFAAHAKERVAELVEELKKQGKLSKPEGEKIVKDFITDTKNARDKFEADVKNAVQEVTQKASLASQKELDMLKKRLLEIEGKGMGMVKDLVNRAQGKNGSSVKKKATEAAKTVKSTAKKVAAAKTPAKAVAAVKAGAKKVVKTATAKPATKPAAKKAATKKPAAKKAAAPKAAAKNTDNTKA
ncbi:MAG: hypothetical protein M0D57_17475 [Sphingobacteriales bacterium JAD_PAG50586_3]|nr:MAG: hypothetical protein M0D57_17475 [Sphingobacteriales bacterium JAD_PAG50586_3]